MNDEEVTLESHFSEIGRTLGRSRNWRVLASIVVAASSPYLAYVVWRSPDFATDALSIGVLGGGLIFAWRLLPFSNATRAHWAENREVAKRCDAYRYQIFIPIGLLSSIMALQRDCSRTALPLSGLRCARWLGSDWNDVLDAVPSLRQEGGQPPK